MNICRPPSVLVALLSLSTVVALSGCKSNNQQVTSQTAQPARSGQAAPIAQQPGDAGQVATSADGQPAASGQPASNGQPVAAAPQAPPLPAVLSLPRGTQLRVRLHSDLSSETSHAGDTFTAGVSDNVLANGKVVIPRGARAVGAVVDAKALGHFKGGALLSLRLDRVHTRWGSYPVATASIDHAENGKGKRSAGFIGGGAAFGALIGVLAGGGKGAAIGALAGGGAGTAGTAFTGNKQIVLPAETLLTFRLEHSVQITEKPQPGLQQR
jgi:hypothetical protein